MSGRATAKLAGGVAIAVAGSLLGGAIGSVLPLGFPPFEPEQSVDHWLAHLVYGITQLPLLHVLWGERYGRKRRAATANAA